MEHLTKATLGQAALKALYIRHVGHQQQEYSLESRELLVQCFCLEHMQAGIVGLVYLLYGFDAIRQNRLLCGLGCSFAWLRLYLLCSFLLIAWAHSKCLHQAEQNRMEEHARLQLNACTRYSQ